MAHYRVGHLDDALAALQKSMELGNGSDRSYICSDCFFLAMANWKLDKKAEARGFYDRAVAWMNKNQTNDKELIQFRAEAGKLLGIANNDEVEAAPRPRLEQ